MTRNLTHPMNEPTRALVRIATLELVVRLIHRTQLGTNMASESV
ncbi:MAG: hypothetical protein QE285_03015 [Aquabacterium sp.]|nr:hypothetical protein [Aquabacterium sp.]